MNQVKLRVNDVDYGGWLEVEISAGIERQARDFKLGITRVWPGATDFPRRVSPGDVCEVFIGKDKMLTGYVDSTPISYDDKSVTVGVSGRSKTADLVDCSADFKNGQWRNVKIERIAKDLASTYGVEVLTQVDTGTKIADHQIDTGETAFESIGRLLSLRQLLSTDDAEGRLILINAGSGGAANTVLKVGENILSADTSLDYKDVFSSYTAKGQRSGNDLDEAEVTTSSNANIKDSSIKRPRNLIIQMSGQVTTLDCQQRVKYERLYRAARALETTYTVQGWRQANGALWLPNQMVKVVDPIVGFDNNLLIVEVTYRLSSGGTTCSLKVAPKDGYIPSPEATKNAKAKKAGTGGDAWAGVK